MDYTAVMDFHYEKGFEEGRQEKEAAAEKAKEERNLEMAKSMLAKGINMDIIRDITGLSKEDIKKIIKT